MLRDIIPEGNAGVTYLDDGIIAGNNLKEVDVANLINELQDKALHLAGKKVK